MLNLCIVRGLNWNVRIWYDTVIKDKHFHWALISSATYLSQKGKRDSYVNKKCLVRDLRNKSGTYPQCWGVAHVRTLCLFPQPPHWWEQPPQAPHCDHPGSMTGSALATGVVVPVPTWRYRVLCLEAMVFEFRAAGIKVHS